MLFPSAILCYWLLKIEILKTHACRTTKVKTETVPNYDRTRGSRVDDLREETNSNLLHRPEITSTGRAKFIDNS